MKSRSSHVRTKIVALLASLVALWAFAAVITLRESLGVLWIGTLDQRVGRPTDAVITALQAERRASLVFVGGGRDASRRPVEDARRATDQAQSVLVASIGDRRAEWAADTAAETRLEELTGALSSLDSVRSSVDAGKAQTDRTSQAYTLIVAPALRVQSALAARTDAQLGGEAGAIVTLRHARELLSQEDALMAAVLAGGTFPQTDRTRFVQLVGAARVRIDEALAALPVGHRWLLEPVVSGRTMSRLRVVEDLIVEQPTLAPPSTTVQIWQSSAEPALTELNAAQSALVDAVAARVEPAAAWAIVRLALAGGLGLVAVVACVIVSATTARALVRKLEQLRDAALELAYERLPRVVDRLQQGEQVDLAVEVPTINPGGDEIGQVGQAFNTVQQTAVRIAVEQAELRRGVRDVFLNLARRSQTLLHRQLGLLDTMERRATDADDLAALFRVDHLATRMRRNAENLIVLSGAAPGRAWRQPVPMIDVVRGALAEVEDYTRVNLLPIDAASLVGRAVGDVIHLLAELIENAVTFSPPQTVVRVGGTLVPNGFVIEIEDRGLGLDDSDRVVANEHLRFPQEFQPSSTARLGLYVVSRLSARHAIRVELRESAYGGTAAIVLIPSDLVLELPDPMSDGDASPVFRSPPTDKADPDHVTDGGAVGRPRPDGRGRPIGVDTAAHLKLPPLPSIGALAPTSPGQPLGEPLSPPRATPGMPSRVDKRQPAWLADLGMGVWTPPSARAPATDASPARNGAARNGPGHNGPGSTGEALHGEGRTGEGRTGETGTGEGRNGAEGSHTAGRTGGGRRRVASTTHGPAEVIKKMPPGEHGLTTEPIDFTPGGLPIRRRADSPAVRTEAVHRVEPGHETSDPGVLAAPLVASTGRHGVPDPNLPTDRTGEAVAAMRQKMAAYQRGTQRGRADSRGLPVVPRQPDPGEDAGP